MSSRTASNDLLSSEILLYEILVKFYPILMWNIYIYSLFKAKSGKQPPRVCLFDVFLSSMRAVETITLMVVGPTAGQLAPAAIFGSDRGPRRQSVFNVSAVCSFPSWLGAVLEVSRSFPVLKIKVVLKRLLEWEFEREFEMKL